MSRILILSAVLTLTACQNMQVAPEITEPVAKPLVEPASAFMPNLDPSATSTAPPMGDAKAAHVTAPSPGAAPESSATPPGSTGDLETSIDLTPHAATSLPLGVTVITPKDLFAAPVENDAKLTCTELFELIKAEQPEHIEDVLRLIQARRPKFLNRSLYQYQTKKAAADASWIYPRLITYGGDAKTILDYGGHARRPGYERLQTLCFDDKQKQFVAYDVVFPADAANEQAVADLDEVERKQKLVIEAGGRAQRTCGTNCHPTSLHPEVDTFALWPGFYGAVDDGLKDQDRPDMRPIYATYEYDKWRSFQSMPAKTGRYRYIHADLLRPNSDFVLKASFVNGERLVGELERLGERFRPHRWEFARALFCAPRAPKKFFTQYDGSAELSANFGVLPEESDATTLDIFLSAYYDQMQKERRLSELLAGAGLPTPLPKEQFSSLRAYYRDLFRPKDLNLDLRLSTVDVDEVLLVRELKRVMDPLGVDLENWSMVPGGGYVFENGEGGPGRTALRLILERPFTKSFLSDDAKLTAAIRSREDAENALVAQAGGPTSPVDTKNAEICAQIATHLPPPPAPEAAPDADSAATSDAKPASK